MSLWRNKPPVFRRPGPWIARPLAMLALIVVVSCNNKQIIGDGDAIDVPSDEVQTWPEGMRLKNGSATIVVVPSIGRIMRYSVGDGPNMLWVNPSDVKATTSPAWKNWGGDKAWPWPQDQWPLYAKRSWPPPDACDQTPMKGRMMGGIGARLESVEITGYAARLVREISLDRDGTRVEMVTRFERAGVELPPAELSAWQVTQLIAPDKMYARMLPGGRATRLAPHPAWTTTRPVAQNVVVLDPPDGKQAVKMGLDADVLAMTKGEWLFVARSQTAGESAAKFRPGERTQVFVPAIKPNEKGPKYIEFEFTSPRVDLAQNQTPVLRTTWELFHAEGKTWTDTDVAAMLRL